MNPPCEDIRELLVSMGVLLLANVHLSRVPETPDALVGIIDQAGAAPDDMVDIYKPMVQVYIRGARGDYTTTYSMASAVMGVLNAFGPYDMNGTHYIGIWATTDILWLGYDEHDRPRFSLNFMIYRSPL